MRIVYYPDPVLRKRARDVEPGDEQLPDLVAGMLAAMEEANGVGLAAPQVGQDLRVFVASETGDPGEAIVCINPRVEPFGASVSMEEGCLSLPGIRADIRRPESVRIVYHDLDGVERTGEFHELMARIIQHEFDHLDGVLFFERMSEADRLRVRADLRTLEEQYPGP
jgi:peptide deformylase